MEENEHIEHLLSLRNQLTAAQSNELKDKLILYLNHLLLHDFNKLVQILYRVDVNENKLKELLAQNTGTNAADIIADLLIGRQEEKIKTKAAFKSNGDIAEEDKW